MGFTIADASQSLVAAGADYVRLIEQGAVELAVYRPLGIDPQSSHKRDELYFIAKGTGKFVCAGESKPFGPGDVLYVKAGIEHRFLNFSHDFTTWVVFFSQDLSAPG